MRTIEQVKEFLDSEISQSQQEVDNLQQWSSDALESYKRDRSVWGAEADNGEYHQACEELGRAKTWLNALTRVRDYINETIQEVNHYE